MVETLKNIFITARPRQWLKNLSLFTGLIFTGWLFVASKFWTVVWATLIFCLITSVVYIINDIIDISKDKIHPYKKNRPIAAGKLPIPLAIFVAILLSIIALWLAIRLSFFFFILALLYIGLHFLYSFWLKRVTILDVMAIASGFIIRIYAGAVVINAHINVWLLLCVVSFSLFLAIGKRRAERTLLGNLKREHREVLSHYPENLLTIYTSMFANTTWFTYALFTFQYPAFLKRGPVLTLMSELPRAFVNQKLLMITVPFVIYGVMRYLQLIYDENQGGSPEEILLTDKPLIGIICVWAIVTIFILYGLA